MTTQTSRHRSLRNGTILTIVLTCLGVLYMITRAGRSSIIPPVHVSYDAEAVTEKDSTEQRFAARYQRLQDGCREYLKVRGSLDQTESYYSGDFQYEPRHLFYCGIEKVGSTEWKGIFHRMSSMHNVTVRTYHDWAGALRGRKRNNRFKACPTRYFFVREPYRRLLSAYVDKLFSPNRLFWNSHGKRIVKRFRQQQPSQLSLQCGHDVTFAEFVDYVIESEKTGFLSNGHFSSQYRHCHVCDFPYSYVGHLETLKEDRDFLLKKMRSPVRAPEDYSLRSLRKQVEWYIRDAAYYKDCLTLDQALRRLWKKLKIRGHLHPAVDYPLTAKQSANVSAEEFFSIASKHVQASKGSGLREKNGKQALRAAFQTVAPGRKRLLARALRWDFQLFGYEPYPPEVFGDFVPSEKQEGGEEEE